MYEILLFAFLVVAILLIAIILLQHGKGADMGASFGAGASNTVFGASGSANFLSRATSILAVLFFSIALALGYLSANRDKGADAGKELLTPVTTETAAPAATTPASEVPASAPASDVPAAASDVQAAAASDVQAAPASDVPPATDAVKQP